MPPIPPLIPRPAEFEFGAGAEAFVLYADTPIQLAAAASDQSFFTARELQRAFRDATGLNLPIRKTDSRSPGVRLQWIADHATGDEDYSIKVSATGIEVAAAGEAGLFYAVQTLKQLLRTYGSRIPALSIQDHPALPHRGLMLDVSRSKVPTLETLFKLVDGLAAYKYNQLQLYVEHTFEFAHHPDIGAGTDPLTSEDMLRLDQYCRARHVELVPNLQSFGHQRHMLSLPQYAHLDEVGWRWSLTPAREETYQLLDELYADFLPSFSSGWLNVDCDETWDLATGQSKALAAERGKGRVYLEHILRLRDLASKHGRRIMLWADVLLHYPELVPELPEDVLLLDWTYEAADEYRTTKTIGASGRSFWVCPGTSSWNTLFPRLDNAITNIRNFVRDGLQAGASGMVLTDWGDYGHYQPLSVSWYPYLFGAATAWTGAQTSPEEFDAAFGPLFLGLPSGEAAVAAIRRLGKAVTAPTLGLHNRSVLTLALFEDPLKGAVSLSADTGALREVRSAAQEAIAAWATLPDDVLRHDLGYVARLTAFAASKTLHAQELRETLEAGSADAVEQARTTLTDDRELVPALRSEFEATWLRHARRSEIQFVLDHFDTLSQHYAAALTWLDEQRSGARVDVDSYTPRPSAILWEQGLAELRKLAEVAGDSLPPEVRAWVQPTPAE